MTRLVRFSNNAVSRLAGNITASATSISLTSGDGSKFPTLSAGQFFMATLIKSDGTTEVVKVTTRSTDTLTVVRAAEPVAGVTSSYAFSVGDRIEARLTADALSAELDRLDSGAIIEAVNKSANYTLTADDVTKLVRVNTAAGTVTITLPQISTLTDDYDVIVAKVSADANSVVIARTGTTDLINGATSSAILNQWQSSWLIADRSTNTWTVISSGFTAVNTVVDDGVGAGSATITLSGNPASKNNTAFFVGGVYQQKSTYEISGTTLTAGGAIASGVGYEVIWSAPLTVGTPSDGTVTTAKLANNALSATTDGLAKMADGFLQATTAGLAKMANGFLAATTAGRAKMADLFVTTAKLADAAVTTAKLADAAVSRAKSASGVVGGWSGILDIGANATLTNADAGKCIRVSSTAAIQINTSTLSVGDRFFFTGNGGTGTVTRTDGGNIISLGEATLTSVVVNSGNGISLYWDGVGLIIENQSLNLQALNWVDVTGSRAFGTTYTNTSGKPRIIHVAAYSGATNGNKQLNVYVNGVAVGLAGFYSTTGNNYPSLTVTVPAGKTYSADTSGSNVSIGLTKWMELY